MVSDTRCKDRETERRDHIVRYLMDEGKKFLEHSPQYMGLCLETLNREALIGVIGHYEKMYGPTSMVLMQPNESAEPVGRPLTGEKVDPNVTAR